MKKLAPVIVIIIFCLSLTIIPGSRAENNREEKEKISKEESKTVESTENFSTSQLLSNSLSFLLSGTKTVGPTGDYTSIGAAITDIQTQGLNGALTLELQPNYVSTVETFPLNFMNLAGISAVNTVTLRPQTGATNLAIAGSNATTIINLENVRFLTIDGRPGGTGTAKELTIENTNTAGATIRFINEASNNTIRHTAIKGATTEQTSGVVFFSTTTGANGNDNNTITNCDIGNSVSLPRNVIFSNGTNSTLEQFNNSNTISNNNIFNFHIAAGDASGAAIFFGNDGWTISGNSFFQTAARTGGVGTTRGIWIFSGAAGGNFTISNNFFGGSQANADGAPWTNSGTTANSRFDAIELNISSSVLSNVQGNVIRNFSWETSGSNAVLPGIFCGIFVQQGAVNIGTTAGNIIGSGTGTGSINVTTSGDGGTTFGIGATGFPDRNIFNNTIGSITTNGTSASVAASLIAIQVTNGVNTITGNTIGSTTTNNSLNAATSSTSATGQQVIGIRSTNFNGATITNNMIANVNNNYAGSANTGQIVGIVTTDGSNTITGNTVRRLSTISLNTGIGANASVIGISQKSTAANQTVSQNTIQSLIYNGTVPPLANNLGTGELRITGIYMRGACLGNPNLRVVKENEVKAYSPSAGAFIAVLFGIDSDGEATYQNNMVSLGVDEKGNDITTPAEIVGINETSCGSNFYFNSVRIGGENVEAGTKNTFAFRSNVTLAPRRYTGNIFTTFRSNAVPGGGKHYAVSYGGSGFEPDGLNCNHNIYFNSGTDSVLALYDATGLSTIEAMRRATGCDASSGFANPMWISELNLHLQQSTPAADVLKDEFGVDVDIDGDGRPDPPELTDAGADECPGCVSPADVTPPSITPVEIPSGSVSPSRTISGVKIEDNDGVAATAVYYKKSTDADVFNSCNCSAEEGWKFVTPNNSSSPFSYTIDYSKLHNPGGGSGFVVLGDNIQYFYTASDFTNLLATNSAGGEANGSPAATTISLSPLVVKFYSIRQAVSGIITVGTGGIHSSFTNNGGVFQRLNNSVLTSDAIVKIVGSGTTETGLFSLLKFAQNNVPGTHTVTVESAPTPTLKTIVGNVGGDGMLRFDNVDNFTFNGSNGSENVVTIRNLNSASPAVRFVGGNNNTFKNLTVESANADTNSAVFDVSGDTSNLQWTALIFRGLSTGQQPANLLRILGEFNNIRVSNSQFLDFTDTAVKIIGGESVVFDGNTIKQDAGTTDLTGISVDAAYSQLLQNFIELKSSGANTTGAFIASSRGGNCNFQLNRTLLGSPPGSTGDLIGVTSFGGGTINADNNQITIILNGTDQRVIGILNEGFLGGQWAPSYNSVVIAGTAIGNSETAAYQSGFSNSTSTTSGNNYYGNFSTGGGGTHYAARLSSFGTGYIANNNIYVGIGVPNVTHFFSIDGVTPIDFNDWQVDTSGDPNSRAGNPGGQFTTDIFEDVSNGALNVIYGDSARLGGAGYSDPPIVSNAGTPIAGITTDFGGVDTRHPTHPDIGSDEGDVNRTLTTNGTLPPGNYDNVNVGGGGGLKAFGGTGVTTTLGGIINIGGTMSVNCNSTLAGASPLAFVNGNVKKDFCAPVIFDYPVGTIANGNEYSPVSVNVTNLPTNPSSLTVKANYGIAPANPPLNSPTTLNRFWTVTETGELTADLLFNYLQTDVNDDESMYRILRVENGGIAQFIPNGVPCPGGGSPCVDTNANTIFAAGISDFSDWAAGIPLAPTAAGVSVGGRVSDASGNGISRVLVTISGSNGIPKTAVSNSFGYYRFENIRVGETYILEVRHKVHQFAPQVVTVTDEIRDLDFVSISK